MKALVYTARGRVTLEAGPRPKPENAEVEIAVELAGVCGSDISGFLGHSAQRKPPLVLGHELTGRLSDGRRRWLGPAKSSVWSEAAKGGVKE